MPRKALPYLFLLTIIFGFLLFFQNSKGYDDKTTHPALTDEIVDFYNLSFDTELTTQEKEWIVQGSIDEDIPPRWINHFYDPTNGNGWKAENLGNISPFTLKFFSKIFLNTSTETVSSKNWVHNELLQTKYADYDGNRTWENAIRKYAEGDMEYALITLGHILHLLEDATVPDHTRNDTHAHEGTILTKDGGSPYEDYGKNFNRGNLNIAQSLKDENKQPIILNSIDEYFDALANYSNKYFFSEHTILSEKYQNPKILREDGRYSYGVDIEEKIFPLAKKYEEWNKEKKKYEIIYTLKDDNNLVIAAYFPRLSNSAVLHGAGVIKLFIEEAEKAKNDKSLIGEGPQISWWQKVQSPLYGSIRLYNSVSFVISNTMFTIQNLFSSSSIAQTSSVVNAIRSQPQSQQNISITTGSANNANQPVATTILSISNNSNLVSLENQINEAMKAVQALQIQANNLNNQANKQNNQATALSVTPNTIQALLSSSTHIFAPGFGGGAPPPASSGSQPEAGADASSFQAQATSTEENLIINLDTEAPDITLSILECENSITSGGCVTSTQTLNIFWSSAASDLDYFITNTNGVFATTTATSTIVSILENSVFSFGVSARDKSGNISATSTKTISTFNSPVVINEVAWAGAQGHSSDEWIELYNNTDYDISLDNWILEAEDGAPYIPLSGMILAKGYYLIERTDDETISDIPADLIAPFSGSGNSSGLSNSGEILILSYKEDGNATTTIDKTILTNNKKWPGGATDSNRTMERIDSLVSGDDELNWGTNNAVIINGNNINGASIIGTPKLRNSISYLIAQGQLFITENIILTKAKSPYLVDNKQQTFQNGSSLTIEPGVVIKFYNSAGLKFENASIIANGTAEEPIIFTSFYDDEYGGDINNDATSTSPSFGNWYGVEIDADDSGMSIFNNIIFRYAGNNYIGGYAPRANLKIDGASPIITNSIFEESGLAGLWLSNSDSVISNNIFRNNNKSSDLSGVNSGVVIYGGNPVFKNNIIENNGRGLSIANSSGLVESNIFDLNRDEAIYATMNSPLFSGNSAYGNRINGIVIYGDITVAGATTTLAADSIPYVMELYEVIARENSALVIEKGVVFKSASALLRVNGNLVIDGEKSDDIIFTSLYDDTIFPGTTYNGTTTLSSYPEWRGIQISKNGSMNARGFTIRLAGDNVYANGDSGVRIEEGSAHISDALFSNNYPYGLFANQSNNLVIENSIFRDNDYNGRFGAPSAMAIYNSSATLDNLLFENNAVGIATDNILSITAGVVEFINNTINTIPEELYNFLNPVLM